MSKADGWRTAWDKARLFTGRAAMLRCPVCGTTPIFPSLRRTRSLHDWFSPLDGCPRCGYPYDREPGYFLLSIWAVNYGLGSLLALALYGIFEWFFDWPVGTLITAVIVPVVIFNLLFARHAKAFFIAWDHYFDPHEREGPDDGGNIPLPRPPAPRRGGVPAGVGKP